MKIIVRDLIDILLDEMGSGRLRGSDLVSPKLFKQINEGHIDASEYLKEKCKRSGVDGGKTHE